MLGQKIMHYGFPVALGLWQGSEIYKDARHRGGSKAVSAIKAVGETAAWSLFPGMMFATQVPGAAAMAAQAMHQGGTRRWASSRNKATPFATHTRVFDSQINQEKRYAAIGELSQSRNVARSQARRMRG